MIMKILVVSDTHLYNDTFHDITEHFKNQVDLMVHCGDASLKVGDPLIKDYIYVKGNHDFDDFPYTVIKDDILITHGHHYDVYAGYDELLKACKDNNCILCLHGHTHIPTHQVIDGIHFVNPGSTMINRGAYGYGTFAIIDKNGSDIDVHFLHHETYEECDDSILEDGLVMLEDFKQLVQEFNKKRKA